MKISKGTLDILKIEEIEKEFLFKIAEMFKGSLEEFSISMDRSLKYLEQIILPIIMGSNSDKSYNPFSEIIEKYVIYILARKFEKEGYKLLPLSYSSDLTLENENYIINIDIKTANLDNPSDFKETINLGINQLTHTAKLRLNRTSFLPSPFFVYPTLSPYYKSLNGIEKLVLTYGLLFIYPPYRELIEEIIQDYKKLFSFLQEKVKKKLNSITQQLFYSSEVLPNDRVKVITENIIRGIFIHEHEKNTILEKLDIENREIIENFSKHLKSFANKLREKNIKPIAIIAIAIPNGLLKEKYIDKFVSGKNYGKSARYHYENGIFEVIKEKKGEEIPRVLFVDIDKSYLDDLKRYFNNIIKI